MPSPARTLPHSQKAVTSSHAPVIDSLFSSPEFDVKAWINSALGSALNQQESTSASIPSTTINTSATATTTSDSNLVSSPTNESLRTSSSTTSLDSTDASLDASLDLLQTPALDPVLDHPKNQDDQDTLSTPSNSLTTTQKQSALSSASSNSNNAQKSHNTILTQHATSHLTKLHLLASQTSVALAATTQDMIKLLPRLTHELDQLRQETKTLQEGILIVRNDINSVDSSDTVQALDRLKYLDLVKTRMEATHSALREAENWRNLEAEAKEIFAKGDFTKAATRLSEAERSLVVYKNTNVEGDRMALLQVLKDQLQQQVMSKVKEAIDQKDTASCQTLINVFGLIGRQEVFQEYYISLRREPLIQHWKRLTEFMNPDLQSTTQRHTNDSKDFISILQTFYKDASNLIHDEFAWITSLFSDPSSIIHNLVRDTFTHIDPTMQKALQHVCKTQGAEGSLPILMSAFAATESFGLKMERVVSQPLVGNQREPSGNRPRAGSLLQDSHSRSPFGESLEIDPIYDSHEWAFILYEPFMVYQREYGKLEGSHLKALLSRAVPAMAPYKDNISKSRELAKSSSKLVKIMTNTNGLAFSLAEGAIGRCMRLTHGFGAPGLLDGVNDFFKEIIDRYTDILAECRQISGLQVAGSGNNSSKQRDSIGGTGQGSKYNNADDDDEGEDSEGWDEDMNEQDQSLFQMGLRLMVLCRQFCVKLEQLDNRTKKALVNVGELIKLDRAAKDSTSQGSNIHGSSSSLDHAVLGTNSQPPNASIAILQQSNLNSFRLSEILDIVKKSDIKGSRGAAAGDSNDGTSSDHLSAETDLSLEPKPNHLFLQSHQRAVQLARLCQRFIFDSIYIPLSRPLQDLASLPCWSEGSGQGQGDGVRRIHQSTMGGTRTDVIKFRSNPNEYMEELLRHLSGLPVTFDIYGGDSGLRFGIHMLPYADRPYHESEQPSTLVTGADENNVGGDSEGDLGVGEASLESQSEIEEAEDSQVEDVDDSAIMHLWVTSLSRAIMHTIVDQLYDPNLTTSSASAASTNTNTPPSSQRNRPGHASSGSVSLPSRHLTKLSESGSKQLELDLVYFIDNHLSSLLIEPTPSVRALVKALRLNESGMSMSIQQLQLQREEYMASQSGPRSRSRRPSIVIEPHHAMVIPGAPVMPTALVVAEDDIMGQFDMEQKVLEWVARLKGFNIS
ncbi:hypothetical protein BGZ76_001758 [Entomortierella beljakovae]|nr:hypothetical protein BGZ76_001758 [Entomortierella beljakovae]